MNRIRLILIVAAVLGIGVLAVTIYRTREPCYKGRTLTVWIKAGSDAQDKYFIEYVSKHHRSPANFEMDPDWRVAHDAMVQMVPDAIPCLLAWVEAKDSPRKKKLIEWLQNHPSVPLRIKPDNYYHTMAYLGFRLLGNAAKPAQSALIQLAKSNDPRCQTLALSCLRESSPDRTTIRPLLLQLIHDPDIGVKENASFWFVELYPQDPEVAGMDLFPSLTSQLERNK